MGIEEKLWSRLKGVEGQAITSVWMTWLLFGGKYLRWNIYQCGIMDDGSVS